MKIKQSEEELRLQGVSAGEQRAIREREEREREAAGTHGVSVQGVLRGQDIHALPKGYTRSDQGIREEVMERLQQKSRLAGSRVENRLSLSGGAE